MNYSDQNLSNRIFDNQQLIDANFQDSNLTLSSFIKANLKYANFNSAELQRANLSYSNLTGSNLLSANLTQANLTHANLSYACLVDANLTNSQLQYISLQTAQIAGANVTGTILEGNPDYPQINGIIESSFIESGLITKIAQQIAKCPQLLIVEDYRQGHCRSLASWAVEMSQLGSQLEDEYGIELAAFLLLELNARPFIDSYNLEEIKTWLFTHL